MKKIMFNDKYGLTQAVLDGRKTQTRRIAYAGYIKFPNTCIGLKGSDRNKLFLKNRNIIVAKSHYKIGEEVAIAQKYDDLVQNDKFYGLCGFYGMPLECIKYKKGCNNKMFVKAELMPHRIRITNIRAERLQYITDEECLAEGIWKAHNVGLEGVTYWYTSLINSPYRTAREAYAALIDKVSGKGTWASNPYVFVYEFELIK